jgi:Mrp family chromosome partitioning ATPase/capsular polysaccharide biosynthesis protein
VALAEEDAGPSRGFDATEQPLGPYLRALRRSWLLVAVVTLLAAAVADLTILRSGPTYQASATVLVSPLPQGDADFVNTGVVLETGEPPRTVQTAAALIDSAQAAQRTAELMGHGWTASRVQSAVSVSPRGESYVLEVTAQAGNSAEAIKLANTFATAAVAYRGTVVTHNIDTQLEELNKRLASSASDPSLAGQLSSRIAALSAAQAGGADPTLAVVGLASSASRTGASHWLIVLLSLIGGFAVASVAALAVQFFNRRLGDLDDITKVFPVPMLAVVPKIGSASASGRLPPKAFPPAAFEQMRLLRVQLAQRKRARVVMLTSSDAGDGKTTIATALAAAFAETGETVILIDFDLRKPNVARLLEIEQPRTPSAMDGSLDELLVEAPDLPGVQVLPAVQSEESEFPALLARLPKLLDEAETQADHVIIDAAPVGFASETLQIAKVCDQVVFAVRPGHTDRQRLAHARDLLTRAGTNVVGLVATQSAAQADTYGYGYGYGYGLTTSVRTTRSNRNADGGEELSTDDEVSDEDYSLGQELAGPGSRRRT